MTKRLLRFRDGWELIEAVIGGRYANLVIELPAELVAAALVVEMR